MEDNNVENNDISSAPTGDGGVNEDDRQQNKNLKKQKTNTKSKKPFKYAWPIKVGILTLALALMFGVLSELMLSDTGIIISLIVLILLLAVSIVFDMVGMAFASCPVEPLISMSSKKIKGSKQALNMVKNADKVASFCSDVIGDICGILSGAAGSAIAVKIIAGATGSKAVIIASVVSALISAAMVFGKAMFKKLAVDKSVNIVAFVGKILSVFSRKK